MLYRHALEGNFLTLGPEHPETILSAKRIFLSHLSTCNPREIEVFEQCFGLVGGESRTLEEVGKQLGVTRERIRQIAARAIRKLRHPTRGRQLQDFVQRGVDKSDDGPTRICQSGGFIEPPKESSEDPDKYKHFFSPAAPTPNEAIILIARSMPKVSMLNYGRGSGTKEESNKKSLISNIPEGIGLAELIGRYVTNEDDS